MSFPNVYTHRRVADGAAKGCEICFKPSTSVLITTENKDFFYICPSHLKDNGFCSPIVDKAAEEARKKRNEEEKEKKLKEEVERVKKEYEEKQRKKKQKEKEGGQDKEKDKRTKKDDTDKDGKDKDTNNKDDKKANENDDEDPPKSEEPRVFALHKFVYQQRLEKRRQGEIARRNRERLSNPSFFPSVPKNLP